MVGKLLSSAAFGLALSASAAFAQTVSTEVQRDENQQSRIEQGLKDGQLSTGEAARLEHSESQIDRTEANADRNGNLSPAEAAKIQNEQNKVSTQIYDDKHNGVTGNPNSASSERMQADVQRNINQQARIEQGVNSGSLTTKETSRLERRQARIANREAHAGAFGHVSANAQARIQHAENRSSRAIYRDKHD